MEYYTAVKMERYTAVKKQTPPRCRSAGAHHTCGGKWKRPEKRREVTWTITQSLRASKVTSGRRSPSRGAFEGTTECSNSWPGGQAQLYLSRCGSRTGWSPVSLSAQSFPCPPASLILTSPEALSSLSRLFPTVQLRGALFKSRKRGLQGC